MYQRLNSFIFILSILYSAPLKDADIAEFIEARYAGADSIVYSMISEDFRYFHTPYVGLGISTVYQDGSLLITGIVDDSLQNMLIVGDRIREMNGKVVSADSPVIIGRVGEKQKLIGVYAYREFYMRPKFVEIASLGIISAFTQSFGRTGDAILKTFEGFKKLITAETSFKNIGGPLSIGKVASDSLSISASYFFQLMALISINLGVINLFPIPAANKINAFFSI